MEKFSRAVRRHHAKRLRKNRKHYYTGAYINSPPNIGFLVNTATVCSCNMCCNPRNSKLYSNPLSLKEQTALDNGKADVAEFFSEENDF